MFDENNSENITLKHFKVLMYNLLCSLNYLHSTNLIHRDIKPENILLTNKGCVKIQGFELSNTIENARVTYAPGKNVKITHINEANFKI